MLYSTIVEKFPNSRYYALSITEFEFIGWEIEDEDFLYFIKNPEKIQIMRLGESALLVGTYNFLQGARIYKQEQYEKYRLLIE
jgi:hypothetical protein